MENTIQINDVDDLPKVAKWLDEAIENAQTNIVALYGAMGSGKTTLVAEFCRQKHVLQTPSSPTFAIVNTYSTENEEAINHFDLYRIESIEEAYDFGYDEYFYSNDLCLIEWPELIEELLPEDTLRIKITALDEESRLFEIVS